MQRKDKVFEFGVVVAVVVIFLILFGVCLLIDIFNSKNEYTLILKPYTILKCEKWECENVSDKLSDYNNKDYKVYLNGKNMGVNSFYYNDVKEKYYIFDKSDNNIYNDERSLIFSGGASINQKPYEFEDINDEEYSSLREEIDRTFLKENVTKVIYDFNSDGINEILFTINNSESGIPFNALIYYDNKKYNLIDMNEDEDSYKVGFSYISNLLDIFDDGNVEFIYTKSYFDNIGSCSQIYRLKGKKFVSVNDCEIVKE